MKATKDHISLETAKSLKDCEVKSKYVCNADYGEIANRRDDLHPITNLYPAYTWQEILWEYPEDFFKGEDYKLSSILLNIVWRLREKQYDEADAYFRENCVLIKGKA